MYLRKRHDGGIDELFAGILEVNRDARAVHGLHLAYAPVGARRVGDIIAGGQCCTGEYQDLSFRPSLILKEYVRPRMRPEEVGAE